MAPKAGFKLPERTALLVFDDTMGEYSGAEIVCDLSVPLDVVFHMVELQEQGKTKEAFELFTQRIIKSWNLENQDGPLPIIGIGGVMPVPLDLANLILEQWLEAVQHPPAPLSHSTDNGSTSETPLAGTENLSPSPSTSANSNL